MSNLYLAHHGILGMHWGIRRFQNKDGSLTAAGKKRYGEDTAGMKSDATIQRSQRDDGRIRSGGKLHYPKADDFKKGFGLNDVQAKKAQQICDNQRDLNKNKKDAFYGIITDDELIDLLTQEQEALNKMKSDLPDIPNLEDFMDKASAANHKWEAEFAGVMSLDDFDAIRYMGYLYANGLVSKQKLKN